MTKAYDELQQQMRDKFAAGIRAQAEPMVSPEEAHYSDLHRLAVLLDTEADMAQIMEAIGQLKAGRLEGSINIVRTLWLVLRHAYHDIGCRLPREALVQTDWSRAYIRRDQDPVTGDVRLTAVERE